MKVAILGENGSVHVQKWIRALADFTDLKIHVITFDRGVKYPDVEYYYLKKKLGNKLDYFLNVSTVKAFMKIIDPDIVHAHYATSYGLLGALCGKKPLMITGWGADIFDSPKNWFMRQLLQFSLKKADALSVLSEITKKEMMKYVSKDILLIPFGVDTNKFRPIQRSQDGIMRIGTIRTLSEKYGIEYLIKGFAKASQTRDLLRLEIVGDGPQKGYLQNLCKDLGVSNKVTFHGYINQNSDFTKYIQLLDSFHVFCILSIIDSETFGVASVEASACGLPIIATNVGGLPEVVADQKTGLLVPPKNEDKVAEAIALLADNASLRDLLGNAGRAFVISKYDWSKNVETMKNVYHQLHHKIL